MNRTIFCSGKLPVGVLFPLLLLSIPKVSIADTVLDCLLVKHEELRDSELISDAITVQRADLEEQVVEVVLREERYGNRGGETQTDTYRGGRHEHCSELSNEQKVTLRLLEDYVNCPYVDGAPCDTFGSFVEVQWERSVKSFQVDQTKNVDLDRLGVELEQAKAQLLKDSKVFSSIQKRWRKIRSLEEALETPAASDKSQKQHNKITKKAREEKTTVSPTPNVESEGVGFLQWMYENILLPILQFFLGILNLLETLARKIFG